MKQKVFFILALLLGLLVPQGTKAYSFSSVAPTGQTLYYNIFGSTVEVIYPSSYSNGSSYSGYTQPSGDLEIPSSVTHNGTTYSVTRIGNYAFLYCSGLTSVTIPNSVTSIGHNAFVGCWGLTSITIPNSVTSIGNCAFSGCSGLTGALTIPNSVTSIGIYAFSGCSGLTSVTIPNSVTSIGTSAFKMVKNVIYGGSLAGCSWGGNTCNGYIEDSLIYSDATKTVLTGCLSNIIFANIPSSVTSIGNYAFYGCSGLRSVTIPNSVTNIGNSAFEDCSGLTTLNFNADSCGGNGLSNDYDYYYHWLSGCTSLTTVNIGNNVRVIPAYAFYNCSGLTSVTIPNSVTNIGESAFENCSGLTTLNFNADSCGGNGFSNSYYWLSSCTSLTTLNIGNNVRVIPDYFARGFTGLTSVTIPNSVTSIGQSAFSGCSGLTSVTIGNSVNTIPSEAFKNCTGLQVLHLGSALQYVGAAAFYNCDHLDTIYSHNPTPATVANADAFENVWKGLPLIVPTGSRSAYASAYVWREFTNIQEGTLPQGIEDAVYDGVSMKSVEGRIVIDGADGQGVTLTDIQGRTLYRGTATEQLTIDVPATGVYLLQVEGRPAKRIAVVR